MFQALLTTVLWFALASAVGAAGDAGNRNAFAPLPPDQRDVPADTEIRLLRTQCYGGCPTYSVTIYADGRVEYVGGDEVKSKGKMKSSISQEKLKDLIAAFKEIHYFDLADGYLSQGKDCPNWGTDMPSAITSITLDGKTKSVKHYLGCTGSPVLGSLSWLEHKIDDAVNVDQWVK